MPESRTVNQPAELLTFLFAAWPDVKKKQVRTWLKFQAVSVNGRATSQFDHPLRSGDVVAIQSDKSAIPKAVLGSRMKIQFEDNAIIVIEKPENLLSVASESEPEKTAYFQLSEFVRERKINSLEKVWMIHRLDRETSGLMIFAKSSAAAHQLQSGWENVEKRYEAVVEGSLREDNGVFESDLDESSPFKVFSVRASEKTRHAVTRYRVIQRRQNRTLVELTLETGRRHQIRVHLADAGCPIVGDSKYGAKTDPSRRVALHACGLQLPHPVTGERLSFESPLPKELARLV